MAADAVAKFLGEALLQEGPPPAKKQCLPKPDPLLPPPDGSPESEEEGGPEVPTSTSLSIAAKDTVALLGKKRSVTHTQMVYIYTHIYIYKYTEREDIENIDIYINIYIYLYICTWIGPSNKINQVPSRPRPELRLEKEKPLPKSIKVMAKQRLFLKQMLFWDMCVCAYIQLLAIV